MKCPNCQADMVSETRREHADRVLTGDLAGKEAPVECNADDADDVRDACPKCGTVGLWTASQRKIDAVAEQEMILAAEEKTRADGAAKAKPAALERAKVTLQQK